MRISGQRKSFLPIIAQTVSSYKRQRSKNVPFYSRYTSDKV